MLQRGRETWRKEIRETVRERERSMGRGETRVSDSEGVRRESKGKKEKVRKLTMGGRRHQKIFIGDTTRERVIVFQKNFLENNL